MRRGKKAIMRSYTLKLTLTFLGVSLVGVALVAVVIGLNTSASFDQFLLNSQKSQFLSAVTDYYQEHGSWEGVSDELILAGLIPSQSDGSNPHGGSQPPSTQSGGNSLSLPPIFALVDQNGNVVVSGGPYHSGTVPASALSQGTAVVVNGQTVGFVLATGSPPDRGDPNVNRFLSQTYRALAIAALGAALVALLLGIILARTVTRPVRDLTAAAHAMAAGQLKQQVPVRSKDELGELTTTFNKMSADLERANQARKQMTADIAHDLRTPLTVITGYLEGLRDGVLKSTPERYEVLFNEARHLQRLVEDLRTLSLADAGELAIDRQHVAPGELLERLAQAYQHQAGQQEVSLALQVEPALPEINVDVERMEQVLGNLVTNALRYTPRGGQIKLSAHRQDSEVVLSVADNGAGITPEVLEHVFERFYRGDEARAQQGDETGLGLAIAKSIVELHGGRITAASEGAGKGTILTIFLPV
jgi:two-component system sensor histidine kinase BaeS